MSGAAAAAIAAVPSPQGAGFIGPRDIGPGDLLGPPPYPYPRGRSSPYPSGEASEATAPAPSLRGGPAKATTAERVDNPYAAADGGDDGGHAAVQEAVRQYLGGAGRPSATGQDQRAAARFVGPYEAAYGGAGHDGGGGMGGGGGGPASMRPRSAAAAAASC